MSSIYSPDTIEFRSISSDDESAICAVYPPGKNGQCSGAVVANGFSPECDSAPTAQNTSDLQTTRGAGCSCALAGSSAPGRFAALAGGLSILVMLGLRRSERRVRRERT
jgi:MYXO-CTERM domain-containing protein